MHSKATEFFYKMLWNFPDYEMSSYIGSITNIRSHFGSILEICLCNLRNGKQYSMKNWYSIGRSNTAPTGDGIEPSKLIALPVQPRVNSFASTQSELLRFTSE